MIFSRAALVLLAIASSAIGAVIQARTPEQLQTDIENLTARVTTLDNDITAFPDTGGSIFAALVCSQPDSCEYHLRTYSARAFTLMRRMSTLRSRLLRLRPALPTHYPKRTARLF